MKTDLKAFFDEKGRRQSQRQREFISFGNGDKVDIYDPNMTFQRWVDRYAQELRDYGNPMVPGLGILVCMLRPDERRGFSATVGGTDWIKDIDTSIQLAGAPELFADGKQRTALVGRFEGLDMVGTAPNMVALYEKIAILCNGIRQYPKALPNIHITGESGSGKELIAKAVHQLGNRSSKGFRKVNCAAIPEDLLESELFGHEQGAFTGATTQKTGLLEQCRGGTVQLDEIDKMPTHQLPKLLRALQEREIRPVGGAEDLKIGDVLFVSSCNVDLASEVAKGEFPKDLWERLAGEVLKVPALCDRPGDIPLLVNHFLKDYPNNPLDEYRFPLAYWCMEQVTASGRKTSKGPAEPISVRGLKNLVGQLVRHATGPVEDPMVIALREAVSQARSKGKMPPIEKAEVARNMSWKGKERVSKSLLNDPAWKNSVQVLVQEGLIVG